MPSARLKPAITAMKRLQSYPLDCTVTRTYIWLMKRHLMKTLYNATIANNYRIRDNLWYPELSHFSPESRRNALIIISYSRSLAAINEEDLRRTVDACGWIPGNIRSQRIVLIRADLSNCNTCINSGMIPS